MDIGRKTVEERTVGIYKQTFTSTCHTHIIAAHLGVGDVLRLTDEHIHIVKLTSFRLVNGRDDNISIGRVAEIFCSRLEHQLLKVGQILCLVGFLEELYATLQVRQT